VPGGLCLHAGRIDLLLVSLLKPGQSILHTTAKLNALRFPCGVPSPESITTAKQVSDKRARHKAVTMRDHRSALRNESMRRECLPECKDRLEVATELSMREREYSDSLSDPFASACLSPEQIEYGRH
jgi:hypothetical protein